ncbi:MAG: TOMM precursor leader peptide-binding protein [Myxococcales bacterium]|nr:TOMM precursor leader peptide-binding protein [Myxococcales bacterium]
MNAIYRFKHHLRVVPAGKGLVFLIGEQDRFLLKGRLYELVVPLVDGRRSVADIVDALGGRASPPEVLYVLGALREKGYTTEATPLLPAETAGFFEALGLDPTSVTAALREVAVGIDSLAKDGARALADALAEASVPVREPATLRVVLTDDYLDPEIDRIAARAAAARTPWLPVKLSGVASWVGPFFAPGEGACWTCLLHRLRTNRPDRAFAERASGESRPIPLPAPRTTASVAAAARLAALEILGILASPSRRSAQRLLVLEHRRLLTADHPVVRRPQCPSCGDGELLRRRAHEPVHLESRRKRMEADGGFRCRSAEETYDELQKQISPLTGIVTHVAPVPGRDHPLRPVYSSAFFACPSHDDPSFDEFGRPTLGKGRYPSQARTGAIAEAIERHSAVWQGDEALVRGSLAELGADAIHPDRLQNFSVAQHARREETNRGVKELRRAVPASFRADAVQHWVPAWSLTHATRRYLPATYCYLYPSMVAETEFCAFDPNGHAAGNCREEAILQGFLELAERDAIAVWWYNRVPRPSVDLDAFEDPYLGALRAHHASLGNRLWVLDLTNDLGIPAFAALCRAEDTGRFCVGFGCHLDARIGVQRALTELNQLYDPSHQSAPPWNDAAVTDRAYLLPAEAMKPRRASDYPSVVTLDLRDDVTACVERARSVGLETIVLDQTRPDTGLSAAKVVVPGLRHIWPRLGPGRLYDVPVKLGWLDRAHAEAELNPVHLFL